MAQEVPSLFRDAETPSATTAPDAAAHQSPDTDASDAVKEARLLSQLLLHFSVKRGAPPRFPQRHDHVSSSVANGATLAAPLAPNSAHQASVSMAASASVTTAADIHPDTGIALASSLLRSPPSERELIHQFLLLPQSSRNKVSQSLFVIPPSLVDDFAGVMQFLLRVILEAHSDSRLHHYIDDERETTHDHIAHEKVCSWARNSHVSCVSYEQEDPSTTTSSSPRKMVVFTLPPGLQTCLNDVYGSVQRNKCEEVWHGDHMAYRCRTCGLSESSCMCLACFDPSDHEGHDYRVYRCSSGGCCDCGDPLAWKPEGFCKKHRAHPVSDNEDHPAAVALGTLEHTIVQGLVTRVVAFCIHVLREVYTFCLRPSGSSSTSTYDGLFTSPVARVLPKTGRRRSSFPTVLQVHLDRLQQCLAWLQALATSCEPYRQLVTNALLDDIPPDFHLDPPTAAEEPAMVFVQRPLVILDVFLKAGVLLPVDLCDTLGVLYLKLLFEQTFKQQYTCHFVDWYPYFIELYLTSSEENNEDGMRNLSRFIDRLFCQLFHSTAQLRELEHTFAGRIHNEDMSAGTSDSTVVERLLVLLLDKLIGLFKSTLRVESMPGAADDDPQRSVQIVDCGRNVFKKRVYARLCSDIRTLLVHPSVAGQVIRSSFQVNVEGHLSLRDTSESRTVYSLLIDAFGMLELMDVQQRHVHQHIEFESQNWTFAFVVDYEMNLLLAAFLAGLPHCFAEIDSSAADDATSKWQLATALLQPLRMALQRSAASRHDDEVVHTSSALDQRHGIVFAKSTTSRKKSSFHIPLHHMFSAFFQAVCGIVRPSSLTDWRRLLFGNSDDVGGDRIEELQYLLDIAESPLQVSLLAREIKAGFWIRNGNVMWQQLVHYYAKHWRYFGLHGDTFVNQLSALLLPQGSLTRLLMTSQVDTASQLLVSGVEANTISRHDTELLEEVLRLVMQLVVSPVLCFPVSQSRSSHEEEATWRLEREMMHWLSLGPFGRSEVVAHLDMKLVEYVRQLSTHEWYLFEEEEIVTNVLERVGEYVDPTAATTNLTGADASAVFGMKMSGTWRLKSELWKQISPLFECFSPSEAQQCEQNVKKQHMRLRHKLEETLLPVPREHDHNFASSRALAPQLLNCPRLLAVLWSVLRRWHGNNNNSKSHTHASSTHGDDGDVQVVNESLLVTSLQCLYVASQLLDNDAKPATQSSEFDGVNSEAADPFGHIERVFKCQSTFFGKLCADIDLNNSSILSMVSSLASSTSSLSPDGRALARVIIETASSKSSTCHEHVKSSVRPEVPEQSHTDDASELSANTAKEQMRRRQQEVMERMRRQQLQFLSSQSQAFGEDASSSADESPQPGSATTKSVAAIASDEMVDSDSSDESDVDDEDDDCLSTEYEEEDEDEGDEWGFPTGHMDLDLYTSHVSTAISLICERERRSNHRLRRRTLSRARSANRSDLEEPSVVLNARSSSVGDTDGIDEEECALCRLPCDAHNLDSTFGYVAMIQPTVLPQKLGITSAVSRLPMFPSASDEIRGLAAVIPESSCESVIWSCGHPVHHACIKGYIDTLWKRGRSHRNPLETLQNHGDERLLSERDLEFLCPVCRRLSNCLLPELELAAASSGNGVQHSDSSESCGRPSSSSEDNEDEANGSTRVVFSRWLSTQMDSAAQVTAIPRANVNETLQSCLNKFCLQLKHRCVRATLQLPLLMSGDVGDELVVESELRHVCETWSQQFSNRQLLLRSLEVELDLTIYEDVLSGGKAHPDRFRLQSLQRLAQLCELATVVDAEKPDSSGRVRVQESVTASHDILFGRRVLLAEDDDESYQKAHGDSMDSISTPVLAHPHLFSIFLSRVVWLVSSVTAQASNHQGRSQDRYSEAVLADVLYSARVVITTQILQAICAALVSAHQHPQSYATSVLRSPVKATKTAKPINEFGDVETVADAIQWAHQLLVRCRLLPAVAPTQRTTKEVGAIEAHVVDAVLPLLRRMVKLIQLSLPRVLDDNGIEPCGLCDELSMADQHTTRQQSKARDELNALLRRLHIPPLRLFFRSFVFTSRQRELCQSWAAQMEANAAVMRRQSIGVDSAAQALTPLSARFIIPHRRQGKLLIDLPKVYMEFFIKYNDKPQGLCKRCNQLPQHPAICLFCGDVLCCFSSCCESPHGGRIGECTQHAQQCGLGTGAFLLLRACTVILFLGNERRCVWGSLYIDKNGEEDPYLRRGRTLFLAAKRLQALEMLLVSHGFSQNTSILTNTSRRDGRRY